MTANRPDSSTTSPPARRRWLRDIAIFVALLLAIQWWQSRSLPAGPAPAFAAEFADGSQGSLEAFRAQHPGRPLALYFWADWCPVCKLQEASVDALAADWPLLTVAMQSGDRQAVATVLAERELHWPTAIDQDGQIAARYGVRGVPTLLVIDANGKVRASAVGFTTGFGMRARMWWTLLIG